jgi:hypothetical protein
MTLAAFSKLLAQQKTDYSNLYHIDISYHLGDLTVKEQARFQALGYLLHILHNDSSYLLDINKYYYNSPLLISEVNQAYGLFQVARDLVDGTVRGAPKSISSMISNYIGEA